MDKRDTSRTKSGPRGVLISTKGKSKQQLLDELTRAASDLGVLHESSTPTSPETTTDGAPTAGLNLPPEPRREDFQTEEEWLEARTGWQHRVAPIIAMGKKYGRPKK